MLLKIAIILELSRRYGSRETCSIRNMSCDACTLILIANGPCAFLDLRHPTCLARRRLLCLRAAKYSAAQIRISVFKNQNSQVATCTI
jgi:hypothetical protein